MAPSMVLNGIHSGMPLTEYSAAPTSSPAEKNQASSLLPEEDLLPDGHPDVSGHSSLICKFRLTISSTSNSSYAPVSTISSRKPP